MRRGDIRPRRAGVSALSVARRGWDARRGAAAARGSGGRRRHEAEDDRSDRSPPTADGGRVSHEGPHEVSGGSAKRPTTAVICIRPSPQTGHRAQSTPVSRCSRAAADSGRASSGGGWPRRSRHQRHDLHALVVGVVLPAKLDPAVAVVDEAIIGQRDAVGIPPEVVEHLLGAGEGPLRIDDPVRRESCPGPHRGRSVSDGPVR